MESFHPNVGLVYTLRSVVDNLILGSFGISHFACPELAVYAIWLLLIVALVWWWRRTEEKQLILLGLGFIAFSYLLVYSACAEWAYSIWDVNKWRDDGIVSWSRYNLFPQVGLSLFLCGGLTRWRDRFFRHESGIPLSRRQLKILAVFLVLMFLISLPRGWINVGEPEPYQKAVLRYIDEVDARCRRHRIAADTARRALDPLGSRQTHRAVQGLGAQAVAPAGVPLGTLLQTLVAAEVAESDEYAPPLPLSNSSRENGWKLLRGSDDPREMSVEEARELLSSP